MKILKDIWNEIIKHDSIVLLTHLNPDGDTIGSSVALKNLILENTEIKDVFISGDKYPRNLKFLETNDKVSDKTFEDSLIIVIDTATVSRIYDKRVKPSKSILIDHHHKEGKWFLGIGGDNFPATGEIIYLLAKENNLIINEKAADGIFVAIWTDTEGMIERQPSQQTKNALKHVSQNKEKIIKNLEPTVKEQKQINNLLKGLKHKGRTGYVIFDKFIPNEIVKPAVAQLHSLNNLEITFAAYLNYKNHYRLSFRSKGNVDVSKVAKHFGGGGHFTSSGAMVKTRDEVIQVLNYLERK